MNRFSIYDSEELSTLELIEELNTEFKKIAEINPSVEILVARDGEATIGDRLDKIENRIGFYIDNPPKGLVPCKCDGVTDDSTQLQFLIDYVSNQGGGELYLPVNKDVLISNEINLKSNISIIGRGIKSKIITKTGTNNNGLNMLKGVEISNVTLKNFLIQNTGYGKSGTWEPQGTFDGVGACILAVGCNNFVVEGCIVLRGGGQSGGQGVGNIYYSCCTNSKIINNFVKYCDNGICVDTWYNKLEDKKNYYNDGVIVSGNTLTEGTGRGICIENISSVGIRKGSIVVSNNTINNFAYAGIQGNNTFNCIVSNNAIDGDGSKRTYSANGQNTWYGIEFLSNTMECIISNNTIKHCYYNGIRCFEASDLMVINNNIKDCANDGIFIKNVNEDMLNVRVDGNNVIDVPNGIIIKRDSGVTITIRQNSVCNNIIRFNKSGGNVGIEFSYQKHSKCAGNQLKPINSYGNSTGIKSTGSNQCILNDNIIDSTTTAIQMIQDNCSTYLGNILENNASAFSLDKCQRSVISSIIRGGTTAFKVTNGYTLESSIPKSINSVIYDTTTVLNGTGLNII